MTATVRAATAPPSTTPGARRHSRRTCAIAALYVAIAGVTLFPTWPSRLGTRIPDESGDNQLNLWILRTAGHHLFTGWRGLWDAPIFWPHHNTLAYSESLLPVALAHRVLAGVTGSDVIAFNLIFIAATAASMFGTFLLARRLTGEDGGAFLAGLIYTLAAPRLAQYGHFQLAFGCLVPIVLLLFLRAVDQPTRGRALTLGITLALLLLSASYYAVMTIAALTVVVCGFAASRPKAERANVFGCVALALSSCALIVTPVVMKYMSLQRQPGFEREPSPWLSVRPSDFLRVTSGNHVLGWLPPFSHVSGVSAASAETRIFPGFIAVVLGTIGLRALLRRRRDMLVARPLETQTLILSGASAVLLLVLSFGDTAKIAGRAYALPYTLVEKLPGFSSIRAPARLVAWPLLMLALLAAIGCATIVARLSSQAKRRAFVVGCTVMLLLETSSAIVFRAVPTLATREGAVYAALEHQATGAVVELPMVPQAYGGENQAIIESRRMLLAAHDGHPRVNGYSGYQPPGFDDLAKTLNTFPSANALAAIERLDVRYVILHIRPAAENTALDRLRAYDEHEAQQIINELPPAHMEQITRYGDAWLVTLRGP